jgi:hypothetical protein
MRSLEASWRRRVLMATQRPNQKMELTASDRYNLLFLTFIPYPAAMRFLARGSSSWSR